MKVFDYNEKRQRGSPDFPIQLYHLTQEHPQYRMPLHWHRELEIIRVTQGVFRAHLNNETYCVTAGNVLLAGSGVLHHGEPEDCVYDCVVFDMNMLRKHHNDAASRYILPLLSGEVAVVRQPTESDTDVLRLTDALCETLAEKRPYYELTVFGLLYALFAALYAGGILAPSPKTKKTGHQVELIAGLVDWMETHYAEPVTLKALADMAGLNEKYLCRLFREYTDCTPIDYINRLRIEGACYEMAVHRLSVTEAAFASGFNDLSYFCRTFKKYKGVTPKQYRANGSPSL